MFASRISWDLLVGRDSYFGKTEVAGVSWTTELTLSPNSTVASSYKLLAIVPSPHFSVPDSEHSQTSLVVPVK